MTDYYRGIRVTVKAKDESERMETNLFIEVLNTLKIIKKVMFHLQEFIEALNGKINKETLCHN